MIYLLQEYLTRSTLKYPDRAAIRAGDHSIRYEELDVCSNRLANLLMKIGVKRQDRTCFILPRGIDAIMSLFGILKSDGVYVALNPKTPLGRAQYILEHCESRVLILNKATYPIFSQLRGLLKGLSLIVLCRRSEVDAITQEGAAIYFLDDLENSSDRPLEPLNIDADLAYILYTSGSTGIPKGVMISHRNVIDYAEWAVSYFKLSPEDRIANTSGVYFDLSVFDVYAGIASGSTIIIVPDALLMFPTDLMDLIDREGVTVWNSVPSLMTYISKMSVLKDDCCGSLKQILFCGEVMPTSTVMDWMRVYPRKEFFNLYGPTETTCESMVYPILEKPSDPTIPLPIGKARANTGVFALTEDLKVASPGEEGELYIRGASVSLGYWRDPEKTAAAFVRSPLRPESSERVYATGDIVKLRADGTYDFIGRKDFQIKYMGYRIELGDIESAFASLDGVVESAVIAVRDETAQTTKIVGFVFPGQVIGVEEIRERLKSVLPPYMIPKEIQTVAGPLPRTPNGKIDRNLLKHRYGLEEGRRGV